jgi:hypothetical protein
MAAHTPLANRQRLVAAWRSSGTSAAVSVGAAGD